LISQPARRIAYSVLLLISIFVIGTQCFADSCDSARTAEKAKLQEYLRKDLNYKVAKFKLKWIAEKRIEFGLSDLLINEEDQAKTACSKLELEVEQAENAYHMANASRVTACSN